MNKRVLIIAPGHDLNDIRIKRSLRSLSLCFQECTIVLDEKYKKYDNGNEIDGFKKVSFIYDNIYKYLFNNKLDRIINNDPDNSYSLIYIHDSGLLATLLLRYPLKKYAAEKLLDYHDWIAWEIYYQITKRLGNNLLSKIIYSTLNKLINRIISNMNVDYLIGISSLQLESLENKLKFQIDKNKLLVIPNTRNKLTIERERAEDESALLWIGNFMRGRDIAKILNYLSRLNDDERPALYICGNIYDTSYFEEVSETGWVKYLGGFNSDEDLLSKIPSKKLIGIFLGWDDKFNTNINEIASPNKVYSYLNLNLPTIYYSRLTNIRDITKDKGCIGVDSFESFGLALNELTENYDKYYSELLETKNTIQWNSEIQSAFNEYVEANFTG